MDRALQLPTVRNFFAGGPARDQFIIDEVTLLLGDGEELLALGMLFEPAPTKKALPSYILGMIAGTTAEFVRLHLLGWPDFPGFLAPLFFITIGFGWPFRHARRWFVAATSRRIVLIQTNHLASHVNRGVDEIERSSIKQTKRRPDIGAWMYTLSLENGDTRRFASEWGASLYVRGQPKLCRLLESGGPMSSSASRTQEGPSHA